MVLNFILVFHVFLKWLRVQQLWCSLFYSEIMGKDMKTIIESCNPEWDDMKTFMFLFPKPQWLFSIYNNNNNNNNNKFY